MLGIDERALRIAWTIFLFVLLLGFLFLIRDTLLVFALAIVFAYMLWPVVGVVERLLPRRRNLALGVVYLAFVGLLVLLGFELVPRIAEQAGALVTNLPKLATGSQLAQIPLPSWLEPVREQIIAFINKEVASVSTQAGPFLQRLGSHILSGLGAILPMILVPILAFFFLKDGESIRVALIGTMETKHDRGLMELIVDDVHVVLKNYIRALVMLAVVGFVAWLLFLSLLHYQYELLLAGIAGVLEFIPAVGPAAALIVILVVAGATGSGGLLWILIFWALYRLFADYVLNPYLMSAGVELHPLLVLFGILAGETIAGIPGMFFSVPAIAILRVIYTRLRSAYGQRHYVATVEVQGGRMQV